MVNEIRKTEKILGKEEKKPQLCEKRMKIEGRRSIAVNCDLTKGTKLSNSHLTWLRPGIGFSPGEEKKIIGKRTRRNLKMGQIIKKIDIK